MYTLYLFIHILTELQQYGNIAFNSNQKNIWNKVGPYYHHKSQFETHSLSLLESQKVGDGSFILQKTAIYGYTLNSNTLLWNTVYSPYQNLLSSIHKDKWETTNVHIGRTGLLLQDCHQTVVRS
jgi:hypothetical protein